MYVSDNIPIKEYISAKELLEYISEEDIYSLVFGEKPQLDKLYTSPFREDTTAGCWFEYSEDRDELRFVDFGNAEVIRGVKMRNINCFDAIRIYFDIPTFVGTLKYVKNHFLNGTTTLTKKPKTPKQFIQVREPEIYFQERDFDWRDARFWSKYQISSENLIEDKVYAVMNLKCLHTRKGSFISFLTELCYAFTDFEDGRKKLYFPKRKKDKRFISTCTPNQIGGINTLQETGELLVITKSYKDWRVLKNQGITNVVWFQNETAQPNDEFLLPLLWRFNRIVIFFDNDEPGKYGALELQKCFDFFIGGKTEIVYIPENEDNVKDPSDMIYVRGKQELITFLTINNLLQ